jgi:outer membrane protein OmpA-like peptidoglycan-associated protein
MAAIFLIAAVSLETRIESSTLLFAQQRAQDVRATLFAGIEQRIQEARQARANLLAPDSYNRAIKLYRDASEDFSKGRSLKDIQRKLRQAETHLQKAIKTAELGQLTFGAVVDARRDALKANAPDFAEETFERAEKRFYKAGKSLESGNVNKAKRLGAQAQQLYRSAELQAIKNSLLGSTRTLLEQARKEDVREFAPLTYARAQRLLSQTEAMLNSNRYASAESQRMAEEAEYEARHAIYLARLIKALRQRPKGMEEFFLAREEAVAAVAEELGFLPRFDEGLDTPLQLARVAVSGLKEERQALKDEIQEKDQRIRNLEKELDEFRAKEIGLQAELAEKQLRIEAEKRRAERIRRIEGLFTANEAVVLRKGNRLILRLSGLTFPSGKAVIQPEYFGLLSKVQRAIREFPEAGITVEGHTDAVGDDRYNETLSIARAEAVRSYLLANMELDERRIVAVGYGETRPVASNETREGRARNRRIDLVLSIPALASGDMQ